MKKFIKKTIAGLIAGVMAVSSMPFVALASDKAMNFKTGISISGYENQYGLMYYTESTNDYAFSVLKEVNKDGVITVKKGSDFTITQSFGTWSAEKSSTAGDESFASKGLHWHYGDNSTKYALGATTATGEDSITYWTANLKGSTDTIQSSVDGTLANKKVSDDNRATSSDGGSHEAYGTYHFTPSSFSQLNTPGEYQIELKTAVSFSQWKFNLGYRWCSIYGTDSAITVTVRVVDDYNFVNTDGTTVKTVEATSVAEALKSAPANTATKYEYVDNNSHKKTTYAWQDASAVTGTTINEVETTVSESHSTTSGICEYCEKNILDTSTYDAQLEKVEDIAKNKDKEYTADSIKKLQEIINDVKAKRENATTQEDIDNLTKTLMESTQDLAVAKNTVTFYTVAADTSVPVKIEEMTLDYGTTYTANAESTVAQWIVKTDSTNTQTKLNTYDSSVSVIVTKDVEIYAYLSDEEATETSSKVTFLGKNGQVVAIKYVANGETLPTKDVPIPEIPFYSASAWDVASITGDGNEYTVKATYYSLLGVQNCTVNLVENGEITFTKDYSYDSYVYLSKADKSKKYALYSDKECTNLLTIIDGVDFYAPKTAAVYVTEYTEAAKATVAVTGSFATSTETKNYANFNCKFYLPEGATAVEWGLQVKVGKDGYAKVKAESKSERNEYTVKLGTSSASSIEGRAYLVYTLNGETVTINSGDFMLVEF